jgi:hypothetical protein
MVLHRYEDWGSTTAYQTCVAWNCVQCGAILDSIIVANQAKRPAPTRDRAHVPVAM